MSTTVGRSLATALVMSVVAGPASAGVICGPRDSLTTTLSQLQEQRDAIGLTAGGMLMEVFVAANGNWTLIITAPNGTSCVVAIGNSWERIEPKAPEA